MSIRKLVPVAILMAGLLWTAAGVWAGGERLARAPQIALTPGAGRQVSYQGRLTSVAGQPLTGVVTLTARLYDAPAGGTLVWEEVHANTPVSAGLFTLMLGETTPLQPAHFSGDLPGVLSTHPAGDAPWSPDGSPTQPSGNIQSPSGRWLEVSVNDDPPLVPRRPVGAVPLALLADYAVQADWFGLANVPAGFADGVDNVLTCTLAPTFTPGLGLVVSGTVISADVNYLQRRVIGDCAPGSAIRRVGEDGGVLCEPLEAVDGLDVRAGGGLTRSVQGRVVTLALTYPIPTATVALSATQVAWAGLSGVPAGFADDVDDDTLSGLACADGQVARWNGVAWGCDDAAHPYMAGLGLALNGQQFSVLTSTVQQRIGATCPSGAAIQAVHVDGSVDCQAVTGGDAPITAIQAGPGLNGGGQGGVVTLSVAFAGPGVAASAARSDHDHDSRYAPVSHDHAGSDIVAGTVAAAHIDPALARDAEVPGLVAAAGYVTRALANAAYAPTGHTHPGDDIVGTVPTAALAMSATHAAWGGLSGVPAGFADGIDDDTTYTAGLGLALSGQQFSVLTSTVQQRIGATCPDGAAIQAVHVDGSVDCQAVTGGETPVTAVQAGPGLIGGGQGGAVTLSVAFAGPGVAASAARSDHDHDSRYAPVSHDHAGSDIVAGTVAAAHIDPALARDAEVPGLVAAAGYITRALANVAYAPAAHTHPGDDIVGTVPTAALALSATQVAWTGLSGVPAGFADDVDDDTTYTAGFGLALSGGQFEASTGTLQARIGQACAVGSAIRAINADGSVECNPANPRPGFSLTSPDSALYVGQYSTVMIGVDGLPLIAYYDSTNGDLKAAHCDDLNCTTASSTTLDALNNVGYYASLAIGSDGLGLIAYYDATNGDLKTAHCNDVACSSAAITTLDSADDVGQYAALAIGSDGLGLIAYYGVTNGDLKVAHCNDVTCTHAAITTLISAGNVGAHASLAIGSDGLGLIAHHDVLNGDLKVAHCQNVTCTAAVGSTLYSDGFVGLHTSTAIAPTGLGMISYYDSSDGDLKLARCRDVACATASFVVLDGEPDDVGRYSSITVGPDGLGLIAYYDTTNGDLKVARCQNASCSEAVLSRLDAAGDAGLYTSITTGVDGLGLISYYDATNGGLKVAHCSNALCTPYARRR